MMAKHIRLPRIKNKIDYTIRMTQFFDHYLKNSPAAKWMTQGIPASEKGENTGLELDMTIKSPPMNGLLTQEETLKVLETANTTRN